MTQTEEIKNKAKELIEKFEKEILKKQYAVHGLAIKPLAKQCAIIHLNLLITELKRMDWTDDVVYKWQSVKPAIENE